MAALIAVGAVSLLLLGAGGMWLLQFWMSLPAWTFRPSAGTPTSATAVPAGPTLKDAAGNRVPEVGHTDLASLTPLPSGPGIQVGEPISSGADRAAQAFGNGCSRWLQLALAGQGELGKTPLWSSACDAARQVKKTRPQISKSDARTFAANLGVTHIAIGEVGGSRSRCILRYRLLGFPGGKEVGAPLTLTGSPAEVLAGLPQVAQQLCARMGVRPSQLPARVVEQPEELQALGEIPWQPGLELPSSQQSRMEQLQRTSPVAMMMSLAQLEEIHDANVLYAVGAYHLSRTPEHPLMLAQTAVAFRLANAHDVPEPHGTQLANALKRFPNNYLLHIASSWRLQTEGRDDAARQAAERAVRCSPGNPSPWISLANIYGTRADRIRNGVTVDRMTQRQQDACQVAYDQELAILRRAAQAAPQNTRVALALSQSAAAAGDGQLADEAFSRVLQRQPMDSDVYWWGVQLYQPKWYRNDAKVAQVIRAAAQAAARYGDQWSPPDRLDLAMGLIEARHGDLAKRVVRTKLERDKLREYLMMSGQ
jgi:tetratricopeptide (TPR) repeat protein